MPNSINNSSRYPSNSKSGFTLIELMVTIVVLAVIVSIAAPSISTQLANQRVKSTTATLINALREAKAESVIRRQPVTVSYINDAGSSNVSIQVPAPLSAAYSSPTLFPSVTAARDWTSLFMSSALADPSDNGIENGCKNKQCVVGDTRPKCKFCNGSIPKPGGGETGDGEIGDGEIGDGEIGDGEIGDGEIGDGEIGDGEIGDGETGDGEIGDGEIGDGEIGDGEIGDGETGDGETGDGETGDGETDGSETDGGETDGGVQASNLVSIAAYNYSAKTLIKSNDTNIVFYPSKRIDKAAPFTYTICDSNNSVSPRQVTVNALGVISSKPGGTC